MTAPVTFALHNDGYIQAMLGPRAIGTIFPYAEDLRGNAHMGGVGAHYTFHPFRDDSELRVYGARSVASARRAMLVRLAEAHEQISELYRPMAQALRAQAEGERG